MEKGHLTDYKSSLSGAFCIFLLENVQKYRKIYKKLVKSYCENTEQKMR